MDKQKRTLKAVPTQATFTLTPKQIATNEEAERQIGNIAFALLTLSDLLETAGPHERNTAGNDGVVFAAGLSTILGALSEALIDAAGSLVGLNPPLEALPAAAVGLHNPQPNPTEAAG